MFPPLCFLLVMFCLLSIFFCLLWHWRWMSMKEKLDIFAENNFWWFPFKYCNLPWFSQVIDWLKWVFTQILCLHIAAKQEYVKQLWHFYVKEQELRKYHHHASEFLDWHKENFRCVQLRLLLLVLLRQNKEYCNCLCNLPPYQIFSFFFYPYPFSLLPAFFHWRGDVWKMYKALCEPPLSLT